MSDDIKCTCGYTHTADDMRSLAIRIAGEPTEVGAEGHRLVTGTYPLCECTDCIGNYCNGRGPAYRRERVRHRTESRWIGERNVCTRCTQTPPIFEGIEYPDADGVRHRATVKWLIGPDTDLAPYKAWDEDFDHYFPLCECGCPKLSHHDFQDWNDKMGCYHHNGEPYFTGAPCEHCTKWREQAAKAER